VAETILAKMAVQIAANTAEFNKALNNTSSNIKTFQKNVIGAAATIGVAFGVSQVAAFAFEVSKLAGEAEGVKKAFDRLPDSQKLMEQLKNATHDTVSELDLMKRSVQSANFGISLSALPKLLEFATLRAQQTGQSVDYLVDSIVTGIGRKSPLILDNLGISAAALRDKMNGVSLATASVGEVADAVGRIASENLSTMGEFSDNASSKVQKLSAAWDNFKVKIGESANGTGLLGKALELLTNELAKLSGDVPAKVGELDFQLAKFIKTGNDGALNAVVENLKSIREEAGKPLVIDATKLIDEYKLSGDEADILIKKIYEINNALGYQERLTKQFTDFAKGYDDINKAAEDFKNTQYQLILQAEIQKSDLEQYTPELKEEIKAQQTKINVYRDLIKATNEYAQANQVLVDQVGEQLGIIPQLEQKLNDLEEDKKKAFSVSEVAAFNDAIKKTREELSLLNAASNQKLTAFGQQQAKDASKNVASFEQKTEFTDFSQGSPTNVLPTTFQDPALPDVDGIKKAFEETGAIKDAALENDIARHEKQLQIYQEQADAAVMFGNIVGEGFAAAIAGEESFATAMKRTTLKIAKEFATRALAAAFSKGVSETPGPPPVGLAVAAASIAIVGAFFSKLIGGGVGGGSVGGGGASRPNVQTAGRNRIDTSKEMRVDFDAVFTFQQGALTAAVKSESTRNSRLNG
jgi:hypothetical protein